MCNLGEEDTGASIADSADRYPRKCAITVESAFNIAHHINISIMKGLGIDQCWDVVTNNIGGGK